MTRPTEAPRSSVPAPARTDPLLPRVENQPAHRRDQAAATLRELLNDSLASGTRRAYLGDWSRFTAWCAAAYRPALPATPETVAMFIADELGAGRAPATLARRLAAIRLVHEQHGSDLPTDHPLVKRALRSARRRDAGTARKKTAPIGEHELTAMIDTIELTALPGVRDRAMLLLGFAAALRRSELVAIDCADIEPEPGRGARLHIRRSKTDQEGRGTEIAVLARPGSPYCPVAAIAEWQAQSGIVDGPLFRRIRSGNRIAREPLHPNTVSAIVKARARQAGLDPAQLSSHSLRVGFVTEAARHGGSALKIQEVTRHRSVQVLQGYVRNAQLFDQHVAEPIFSQPPKDDPDPK